MKENFEITVRGKDFVVRELRLDESEGVMTLQAECMEALPDSRLYYPLTQEELRESLQLDKVVGVFVEDELVAVAVIVMNRTGSRNLAPEAGLDPHHTFTFDAVLVSPRWRGYGFQKLLLKRCLEIATDSRSAKTVEESSAKTTEENGEEFTLHRPVTNIVATVAPDNVQSLKNFLSFGFEIVSTANKYSNLLRHILNYTI